MVLWLLLLGSVYECHVHLNSFAVLMWVSMYKEAEGRSEQKVMVDPSFKGIGITRM